MTEILIFPQLVDCSSKDHELIMVVLRDVSDHVQQQETLKKLNKYKDELMATVTHDLRGPLNGMVALLEVGERKESLVELKELTAIIKKNCFLLQHMINDILDYSQIKNEKLRLNPAEINLQQTLNDVEDVISFQAKQKHLDFVIETNVNKQDLLIITDQTRLKQILLNLTGNALKFTSRGEIRVIVDYDEADSNSLVLSVKDTGVGISETLLPNLFRLYATYDNGLNKSGKQRSFKHNNF